MDVSTNRRWVGSVWWVARAALLLGLMVLLVLGGAGGRRSGESVQVSGITEAEGLIEALIAQNAVGLEYVDTLPPTRNVATVLAGAAARGKPVRLVVPGGVPTLTATMPRESTAMRRTAISVRVRSAPGTVVPVTIQNPSGIVDTISVEVGGAVGGAGVVQASLAVEPVRSGASTWIVRAGDEETRVSTWARHEAATRVLVVSAAPSWESRYLVRGLEEAGAIVDARQGLGRGRVVASAEATLPTALGQLERYDVVAVLGETAGLSTDLLRRWVRDEGGGVLVSGPGREGSLGLGSPTGSRVSLSGTELGWVGPAEIAPLPAVDVTTTAFRLEATTDGAGPTWSPVATDESGNVYSAAGWMGRGRVYVTGVETWPWAMESGRTTEHSDHWESVIEWLAGGLSAETRVTGGLAQAGVAWTGRVEGTIPDKVELARSGGGPADGSTRPEVLEPGRSSMGVSYLRFVAASPGSYTVSGEASGMASGFSDGVIVVDGESRSSWSSAALVIGGTGGEIRARSDGSPSIGGTPLASGARSRWLTFLVLGALAVIAWTARRLEGLP